MFMTPTVLHHPALRKRILITVAIPFALFAAAFASSIYARSLPGIICCTAGLLATGLTTAILARRVTEIVRVITSQYDALQNAQSGHQEAEERLRAIAFELESARQLADAASQAKSDFLARMSHEIRTPMTAILGYADKILDVGDQTVSRNDCVRVIKRSGEHLLALINDILDLSKVEAGKMEIESLSCAPASILSDVASIMRVRAQEKQLDFIVEREGPLPERIVTDPTRLRQILINLIGNAVKFTQHGRVKVIARLTGPTTLVIEVSDTGIGLTPDQIRRLFRAFEQGDASTARRFGGSGLGLCVSHRLAQMLGGEIVARSEEGAGSAFTLTIPTGDLTGVRMIDSDAAFAPVPVAAPHILDATTLAGRRVLLADDTDLNRDLVSYILQRYGATVDEASDGLQAVALARQAMAAGAPYDAVLMDVEMPGLDGYSATSRLRFSGYDAPILALTAHAMSDVRDRCIDAGCNDYLAKPINPVDLAKAILKHARLKAA